MFIYLDGLQDAFKVMHEHCRNGHQVQNPNDRTEWYQCCFLLEEGKFSGNWKCCFERCPLIKEGNNYEEI